MLGTGLISDTDYPSTILNPPGPGIGVGVEGPRNGDGGVYQLRGPGVTSHIDSRDRGDLDFKNEFGFEGWDTAALEFQCKVGYVAGQPVYPGFFKITFVMATDEHPHYLALPDRFFDSVAVFVKNNDNSHVGQQNIVKFRDLVGTSPPTVAINPMNMEVIYDKCQPIFFKSNQVAPAPDPPLPGTVNLHPAGTPYYDVQYGGFTIPFTRQSGDRGPSRPEPVPPGQYTVKLVIQDATDPEVDAAAFFKSHSFEYQAILPADFDMNGIVDAQDYIIWNTNKYTSGKRFTEGDANFNGTVDADDFMIWNQYKFTSGGHPYLSMDFNDDGVVDASDLHIVQQHIGITTCASRFEGDADGDGDVDCHDCAVCTAMAGAPPTSCPACDN